MPALLKGSGKQTAVKLGKKCPWTRATDTFTWTNPN